MIVQSGPVVAIGNFDGAHRGHAAIAREARRLCLSLGGSETVALTFEPHPRRFFQPNAPLFRLTDAERRSVRLRSLDFDRVETLVFDQALAGMTAEEFVRLILVERLRASGIVVGADFHFGRGREGTPEFLKMCSLRHGFALTLLAPYRDEEGPIISSSAIRAALAAGELASANRMLGYSWDVSGTVIHGEKRGRDLGYPTANIRLDPDCAPAHGIYAVLITIHGTGRQGVASFGRRPTFDNGAPLLEVHVFDFAGDLYGKTVDVSFKGYLRPEMKFDSLDALIRQMDADSAKARTILSAR